MTTESKSVQTYRGLVIVRSESDVQKVNRNNGNRRTVKQVRWSARTPDDKHLPSKDKGRTKRGAQEAIDRWYKANPEGQQHQLVTRFDKAAERMRAAQRALDLEVRRVTELLEGLTDEQRQQLNEHLGDELPVTSWGISSYVTNLLA